MPTFGDNCCLFCCSAGTQKQAFPWHSSKSTNARWDHSWDMLSPEQYSRSWACGGFITYFIGIFIQNVIAVFIGILGVKITCTD
ncbi:unnamed protein product, partial [Allacma fusca]